MFIESTDVVKHPAEEVYRLVRDEIPANVTFELFVGEHRMWPDEAAGEVA